jgi:uncharacterized membrane protein YphA (DoxX/SURF4 family)
VLFATAALIGQSIVIIGHAHWAQGFWNGKNGIEFPLTLAAGVLAIALVGPGSLPSTPRLVCRFLIHCGRP